MFCWADRYELNTQKSAEPVSKSRLSFWPPIVTDERYSECDCSGLVVTEPDFELAARLSAPTSRSKAFGKPSARGTVQPYFRKARNLAADPLQGVARLRLLRCARKDDPGLRLETACVEVTQSVTIATNNWINKNHIVSYVLCCYATGRTYRLCTRPG